MSVLKKDKQKVLGEEISVEKAKEFLSYKPYGNSAEDFHILVKAYRGLSPEGFKLFIDLFKQDGRDVNACDDQGVSFLETIRKNEKFPEYVEIMEAAGAL